MLLWKLVTGFTAFQLSFFQVKMINHCEVHVILQDIKHQLQEISFMTFFMIAFYDILIKLSIFNLIHSKLFTVSFCDIAKPYKLFTCQYSRYDDFLFLSYCFICLLLSFVYCKLCDIFLL